MISVVEMNNGGITTVAWLCETCAAHRKTPAGGAWSVKPLPAKAHGPCDDCERARQLAPGYASPTVDFLTTPPEAFAPAPGWKADAPVRPWVKPERKATRQRPIGAKEAA